MLRNDLKAACASADVENRHAIYMIVAYLHTEVPGACWGSPEAVANWTPERAAEIARMRR
jgi:hypothetical protein